MKNRPTDSAQFRSFTLAIIMFAASLQVFSQGKTPKEEVDRLMLEAAVAIKEERPDEAIRKATRILELFPRSGDIYVLRGTAYLLKQDSTQAKIDFTSAINFTMTKPQLTLQARRMRGMINYQTKLYEDAIADLTIAISMNPGNAGDHSFRGWSHFFLGRNKEAVIDFDKAIEINPKGLGIRRFRAQANSNIGNYQLAVDDITEELKLNSSPLPEAYKIRAKAYRKLGKEDLAIADEQAFENASKVKEKAQPKN